MNRNIVFGLLACLVLILLIISVGIPDWPCRGNIFGTNCIQNHAFKVVGFLLAAAIVGALLVAIFLLLVNLQGSSRMAIAAIVAAGITALLAIAGAFYLTSQSLNLSPILAAFGAGIALALFVALLLDYRS
ncbi:unnamed protein product [Rodentolepis nana]|uniref:DUF4383 domain-containing protein n=1 Tax=Rodentolepis nana TaxID=102285 RepID=A0A0R3T2C0_RODNA|nr:unnamed protein product [Rodentolepis nana]